MTTSSDFIRIYISELKQIVSDLNADNIQNIVNSLAEVRDVKKGRVFVLGIGGSAGNASHMVNDLRKLCGIETYCPTDNVSEFSARVNDEGFETVFEEYLKVSKLNSNDLIFVLSVGGGNKEKNVSVCLINAIDHAKKVGAKVCSIVGKSDGYAAKNSDSCFVVPNINPQRVTPHSEAFQAVVWHCIVSHPDLQTKSTKW